MAYVKKNSDLPPWVTPNAPHGRKKKPTNYKFYNSKRWRRLSTAFRMENPLCAECERKGIMRQGQHVDHIIPINQGGPAWDWDNLQTLCLSCHARKTAREGGGRFYK